MSFDPQREDYERLGLRFARSLDSNDPANAAHAFATFGRRFAQDRDSLPQSDSDRAFHLVAEATRLIDYELPFATEDRAAKIIDNGHRLLDEALAIDPTCYDALRMKAAAQSNSFEGFLEFLSSSPLSFVPPAGNSVTRHCRLRYARTQASGFALRQILPCAPICAGLPRGPSRRSFVAETKNHCALRSRR